MELMEETASAVPLHKCLVRMHVFAVCRLWIAHSHTHKCPSPFHLCDVRCSIITSTLHGLARSGGGNILAVRIERFVLCINSTSAA